MATTKDININVITSAADIPAAFGVNVAAFGNQTNDGIWGTIFPNWQTSAGRGRSIQRLAQKFGAGSTLANGEPTTIFLKATAEAPDESDGSQIVGFAIWTQASLDPAHGEPPHPQDISDEELEFIYPGNPTEQRYLRQLLTALHNRRNAVIQEKADANPPAVFVLDSCAVLPSFQRRGIANALVQWGLQEAKRRGGLECITEGSLMGRHVYLKAGFHAEGTGEDMKYDIDPEFADRPRPGNLFLRTAGK